MAGTSTRALLLCTLCALRGAQGLLPLRAATPTMSAGARGKKGMKAVKVEGSAIDAVKKAMAEDAAAAAKKTGKVPPRSQKAARVEALKEEGAAAVARREAIASAAPFAAACVVAARVENVFAEEMASSPAATPVTPTTGGGAVPAAHLATVGGGSASDSATTSMKFRSAIDETISEFLCPLTSELPLDPVTAEDGHCYEREAITHWLRKKRTSPRTKASMGSKLFPAMQARRATAP